MMWKYIENVLRENNYILNNAQYDKIFDYIHPEIETWANRAHYRAQVTGIIIPKNDFISYFVEAIWQSIEFYVNSLQSDKKYELSHIITHRVKIAEASVWRNYKNRGTTDRNQEQYLDGKWMPLSKVPESTFDFMKQMNLHFQIEEFKKHHPSDGIILDMLVAGYKPKEICLKLFNCTEYSPKYRKRINRVRKKFKEFLYVNN